MFAALVLQLQHPLFAAENHSSSIQSKDERCISHVSVPLARINSASPMNRGFLWRIDGISLHVRILGLPDARLTKACHFTIPMDLIVEYRGSAGKQTYTLPASAEYSVEVKTGRGDEYVESFAKVSSPIDAVDLGDNRWRVSGYTEWLKLPEELHRDFVESRTPDLGKYIQNTVNVSDIQLRVGTAY